MLIKTNDPLAYPIYVLDDNEAELHLPDTGTYYVICRSGIWLHKDNGIVTGTVRVDGIGHLAPLQPRIGMRLPRITVDIIFKAILFFRRIYKRHCSESALILFFNKDTQEFALVCPEQIVTYGSVNYNPDQRLDGHLMVGTIHSHCNFAAYHSGTDMSDEADFDGIHITIGHLDCRDFSLVCSLVMNGSRVQVDPLGKIEGLDLVHSVEPYWSPGSSTQNFFRFHLQNTRAELKDIIQEIEAEIVKEWMPLVSKRVGFFSSEIYRPRTSVGHAVGLAVPDNAVNQMDEIAREFILESPPAVDEETSIKEKNAPTPPAKEAVITTKIGDNDQGTQEPAVGPGDSIQSTTAE